MAEENSEGGRAEHNPEEEEGELETGEPEDPDGTRR
ncbi:MAG: hypothetical protein QOF23_1046 [Solirubrobacterales bacterium]|jgi:hypothetical protein|nr:hypothetical protein [Solirubrobacterales bacterium]